MSPRDPGSRSALVAGASGLVGSALVARLRDSGEYDRVHLLVRRSLGITGDVIREHQADFDRLEDLAPQIGRVDAAFCCLGTTIRKAGSQAAFRRVDHDFVVAFGRFAVDLGARTLVVVSSLGADPEGGNFYLRVKGDMERDLAKIGPASLVILRPSLLIGDREEFRPGERVGGALLSFLSPLMVGRLGRVRPVGVDQVACAMARVVCDSPAGIRVLESEEIRTLADSVPP